MQRLAAELVAAGIPATYRDADVEHGFATGGTDREGLVLRGHWWMRTDPRHLVDRAWLGIMRSRYGQAVRDRTRLEHGPVAQVEAHGLLAGAPLPAACAAPSRWRLGA